MVQEVFAGIVQMNGLALAGMIILTLVLTVIAGRILKSAIRRSYERVVAREAHIFHINQTHYIIVSRLVIAGVYVLGIAAAIYQVPQARTLFYSAMAGAGVLALIVGFATKDVFANIVSGISIVIYNPFRVGDKITINNETGTVEDITLRHTVIRTWENKRIVIPNSVVSSQAITNATILDPKIQKSIDVSISYESDIDKAKKIMLDEARKHPDAVSWTQKNVHGKTTENGPRVFVVNLADSGVVLRLYFWTRDFTTSYTAAWELLERIKKRFDRAAIEIPYPHRTIVQKRQRRRR